MFSGFALLRLQSEYLLADREVLYVLVRRDMGRSVAQLFVLAEQRIVSCLECLVLGVLCLVELPISLRLFVLSARNVK